MTTQPGRTWRRARKRLAVTVAVSVGAAAMVLPLLWLLGAAFSPSQQALTGGLLPGHPTLKNFSVLASGSASGVPVWRWLLNSILVSTAASVLVMVIDSLAAYGLARTRFPGRRLVFALVMASLVVPFIATLIPLYLEFDNLRLLDSYGALILPYTANAFGVFLLFQFFRQVPVELEQAAKLDGAGRLRIWWRIFVPIGAPAIATLGILTFMNVYNDFFWPLVATSSLNMRTITVGIAVTSISTYSTDYGLLTALTVFSAIPMVIAFIFAQRRLVAGISMTGLQG